MMTKAETRPMQAKDCWPPGKGRKRQVRILLLCRVSLKKRVAMLTT